LLFYPVATGGWIVKPWHIRRAERTSCAGLNASYVVTAQHQSGTLIRR
jgi:hypothetical protein